MLNNERDLEEVQDKSRNDMKITENLLQNNKLKLNPDKNQQLLIITRKTKYTEIATIHTVQINNLQNWTSDIEALREKITTAL